MEFRQAARPDSRELTEDAFKFKTLIDFSNDVEVENRSNREINYEVSVVENNDEDKRYSALHIALADKDNDRDVEVLLKYLCMTPINVNNYSDIIHKLIKF